MAPGSTFRAQSSLPPLPVPDLLETLARYRESLVPFLSASELAASDGAIKEFIKSGAGKVLHERLLQHAKKEQAAGRSWLETWWYCKAYLENRDSLLVHSNWWLLLRSAHIPKINFERPWSQGTLSPFSGVQIARAAALSTCLLSFRALLEAGCIPADRVRRAGSAGDYIPMCMDQYKLVFGVTRTPRLDRDIIKSSFPCKYHHLVILTRGLIYSVDVSRFTSQVRSRATQDAGRGNAFDIDRRALYEYLLECFFAITRDANKNANDSLDLGPLTATGRTAWAQRYTAICAADSGNKANIELIENAVFAVSLDDKNPGNEQKVSILGEDDESLKLHMRRIAHGNGDVARDRWLDKSLNLIITPNGHAGCCGEHSPQDALTPAFIFDFAVCNETAVLNLTPQVQPKNTCFEDMRKLGATKRLEWKFDNFDIKKAIDDAVSEAKLITRDSDIEILSFRLFGAEKIKREFKLSPDAFVQLAMQLAMSRQLNGNVCSTYETASTRMYFHGRTETCRSASHAALLYVRAMKKLFGIDGKNEKYTSEAAEAFKKAAETHIKNLSQATRGCGVDRHLLGLRLCMLKGEVAPKIFTDPAFAKSSQWMLSTSSLHAGAYKSLLGTGFGSVHKSGYGINYFFAPDHIRFGIESKHSCSETSSPRMCKAIERALCDQAELLSDYMKLLQAKSTSANFKITEKPKIN